MLKHDDYVKVADFSLRVMLQFRFNNKPNGDVCYILEYKYSHWHRAEFTICPAQNSMVCSIDLSDKKFATIQDMNYHIEFINDIQKIFNHFKEYGGVMIDGY